MNDANSDQNRKFLYDENGAVSRATMQAFPASIFGHGHWHAYTAQGMCPVTLNGVTSVRVPVEDRPPVCDL